MSLDKIQIGDYGQVVKLTMIDVDTDAAADVSGYTTSQQFIFQDPSRNNTAVSASFDSDGSDGVVKYTLASGLLDEQGRWTVRARVKSGSAQLTSEPEYFDVE